MSDEHKTALAEGRRQGRAVSRYLEALESNKPKRGRKRTRESVLSRLETIDEQLPKADPLRRLQLRQERLDLAQELATMDSKVDLADVEADFVAAAKAYGERKGISYEVWREAGVPPSVLKRAAIAAGGRRASRSAR